MAEFMGPYRLLKPVMSGQTSQIWEGINDKTRERFALKFLNKEHCKEREHITYLKHEYEVGKELEHKNVIQMFELSYHDKNPFIVMELYLVPSLKIHLGNLGVEGLAPRLPKILLQAATALNFMHQKGWIHRDIKPDNFLADDDNVVKMIDFALAEKPKSGLMKLFGGKTKVQGTRSYMAPEQIRGETLTFSADIYSFGCMAYELISGKPPFVGTSSQELLQRHLRAAPTALEAVNSSVSKDLAKIVADMLAKKPEDRPESMAHVVVGLKSIDFYKKK